MDLRIFYIKAKDKQNTLFFLKNYK